MMDKIEEKLKNFELKLESMKNERAQEIKELAAISDSFDIDNTKNEMMGRIGLIQNKIDEEFANIRFELKNVKLDLDDLKHKIMELENEVSRKPIVVE